MSNKMFYSVRIMAILGLSLIGTCYHAYAAYTITVLYNDTKAVRLVPGYTYKAKVVEVGLKINEDEYLDKWENKKYCHVKSVTHNQKDQTLYYKLENTYIATYKANSAQIISFHFLLNKSLNEQSQGAFCQIEITAYGLDNKPVVGSELLASVTEMSSDLFLPMDEPLIKQVDFKTIEKNSFSEDAEFLRMYSDNEEADHGCCGGSKKRPHCM